MTAQIRKGKTRYKSGWTYSPDGLKMRMEVITRQINNNTISA
jgi:hypothetical protein